MQNQKDVLSGYFSEISEEESKKRGDILNQTSSTNTRADIKPGKYLMKVNNFAGKKKEDGNQYISPNITVTKNKALSLNFALAISDAGTIECPKGTTILHSIIVSPSKDATEEKVANTYKFAKPQIVALIGKEKFEMSQDFISEYLTIDCEVTDDGKLTVIRNHKMLQEVYVTIDEQYNEYTGKIEIVVKEISPKREGLNSITIAKKDEDKSEKTENNESTTSTQEELMFTGEKVPGSVIDTQAPPMPEAEVVNPVEEATSVDTSSIIDAPVADGEGEKVEDF